MGRYNMKLTGLPASFPLQGHYKVPGKVLCMKFVRVLVQTWSQRLQRRLSREATAHLHHVVQVRESKLGALPRLRVGKEGLKKAFLASVADYLQAHGVVK
eukprot:scaffold140879_cov21-Tisochrysis_lutea.AAC.1